MTVVQKYVSFNELLTLLKKCVTEYENQTKDSTIEVLFLLKRINDTGLSNEEMGEFLEEIILFLSSAAEEYMEEKKLKKDVITKAKKATAKS